MLKNKFGLQSLKGQTENLLVRAISAWCFTGLFNLIISTASFTSMDFTNGVNLLISLIAFLACFLIISIVELLFGKRFPVDSIFLLGTLFPFVLLSMQYSHDNYYAIGMVAVLAAAGYYIMRKAYDGFFSKLAFGKKGVIIMAVVLGLLFSFYVGGTGALRYWTYRTPCFDFGIFSQMFYYMKETFEPLVTCERDGLLSHFAVHFSPIYYLLLPFYFVFPTPATLEIGQAVILASGLIPLYLICRRFKLSDKATLCVLIVYIFFPALAGGTYYDLHENKFLAPLVLWLMYFIERKSTVGIFAFALLTCLVKEDAPVYVAFIALYMIMSGKDKKRGFPLLVFAVAYFGTVIYLLGKYGQGAMVNRYDNFIFNEDLGLISVVITCIVNPLYVFKECFDAEKMLFAALMLIPTGFLCFATKKYSRFILIGPFILVNLMPDYVYQHSIYFQYTYAVAALFLYLVAANAADLKSQTRRYLLSFAAVACVGLFMATISGMKTNYFQVWNNEAVRAECETITQTLKVVPEDAEVTADTLFVANLSKRDVIYQIESSHVTEWVVVDLRGLLGADYPSNYESLYLEKGYEIVKKVDGVIAVMKLPENSPLLKEGR